MHAHLAFLPMTVSIACRTGPARHESPGRQAQATNTSAEWCCIKLRWDLQTGQTLHAHGSPSSSLLRALPAPSALPKDGCHAFIVQVLPLQEVACGQAQLEVLVLEHLPEVLPQRLLPPLQLLRLIPACKTGD